MAVNVKGAHPCAYLPRGRLPGPIFLLRATSQTLLPADSVPLPLLALPSSSSFTTPSLPTAAKTWPEPPKNTTVVTSPSWLHHGLCFCRDNSHRPSIPHALSHASGLQRISCGLQQAGVPGATTRMARTRKARKRNLEDVGVGWAHAVLLCYLARRACACATELPMLLQTTDAPVPVPVLCRGLPHADITSSAECTGLPLAVMNPLAVLLPCCALPHTCASCCLC